MRKSTYFLPILIFPDSMLTLKKNQVSIIIHKLLMLFLALCMNKSFPIVYLCFVFYSRCPLISEVFNWSRQLTGTSFAADGSRQMTVNFLSVPFKLQLALGPFVLMVFPLNPLPVT